MAQVINYFSATVVGSAPLYTYGKPDGKSSPVRVYAGDTVSIKVSGTSPATSGSYYVLTSNRYIAYYNATNLVRIYKTVTDRLGAPTLTMDRENATLTFTGGTNGDLNTFSAYRYQYRERVHGEGGEWGAWSNEESISASASDATKTLSVEYRRIRSCMSGPSARVT